MNPIAKNVIAVILGLVIGGVVNMAIIICGPLVVPMPEGADFSTAEGAKASIHLLRPVHFAVPFLAHALGTLVGAFVAAKLAASHRMKLAIVIGVFFLLGGIAAAQMIGAPLWFTALDLIIAYIPMAIIGGSLGRGNKPAIA
jgi:hypothetical protein